MKINHGFLLILIACAGTAQDSPPSVPAPRMPLMPKLPEMPGMPPMPRSVPFFPDRLLSSGVAGNMAWHGLRLAETPAMQHRAAFAGSRAALSDDEQMKLIAIDTLMQSDPERAIPLLDKLLQNPSSSIALRQRAVSALSRSRSPKAREIILRIAKGERNSDLQLKALQYLSAERDQDNKQFLAEVYSSSADKAVKRQVLQAWLASGDRDQLLKTAKTDSNTEMRIEAIRMLGATRSESQLAELYGAEPSTQVREHILRTLVAAGNAQKLIDIAKTEKDPDLRERAIRYLSTLHSPAADEALVSIYVSSSERSTRTAVLRAFAASGNAKKLIEAARQETSPELKQTAVQYLTHMKSKDASDFLMELLAK